MANLIIFLIYHNVLLAGVHTQHVLHDRQPPSLPTNYRAAGGNYATLST